MLDLFSSTTRSSVPDKNSVSSHLLFDKKAKTHLRCFQNVRAKLGPGEEHHLVFSGTLRIDLPFSSGGQNLPVTFFFFFC